MTPPPHPPLESVSACLSCGATHWSEEARVRAQMMPLDAPDQVFTFVRCDACGLVFLNPRVPEDGLGRYYTDAYLPYRGPDAWGVFAPLVAKGLRDTDRARVRLVRREARLGPGARVLDVGCGKPSFLESLVGAAGCRGTGTDFSDAGWRDDPARWSGLTLLTGDLRDAEVMRALASSGPFQLVTMWHYLEHDYAPRRTLEQVRGLVGSTGGERLVIEVPNHDSWTRRRHGDGWAGYHVPRHTALYTPDTLAGLLERSGWEVVEVLPRGTLDPYVLHWMSRMEARRIDWSRSMAPRFADFLAGKVLWSARFALGRPGSLGVMTAVARPT